MTTVGYGDVVPVTPWGKVLAGPIGMIGIGMVALPAGLLASGFSDQLHQRRREFEVAVDRILASGTIGPKRATSSGRFAIGSGCPTIRRRRSCGTSCTAPRRAPPALRPAAGTAHPRTTTCRAAGAASSTAA